MNPKDQSINLSSLDEECSESRTHRKHLTGDAIGALILLRRRGAHAFCKKLSKDPWKFMSLNGRGD